MEDLRIKCEDKKQRVDEERKKFMEFKKQVALNAISNRSGKPVPPKVPYLTGVVVDGHIFQFHYVKHSILLLTKITMVLSLYRRAKILCFLSFSSFNNIIQYWKSWKRCMLSWKITIFSNVFKAFQPHYCVQSWMSCMLSWWFFLF